MIWLGRQITLDSHRHAGTCAVAVKLSDKLKFFAQPRHLCSCNQQCRLQACLYGQMTTTHWLQAHENDQDLQMGDAELDENSQSTSGHGAPLCALLQHVQPSG